jgi:hypothetical protein
MRGNRVQEVTGHAEAAADALARFPHADKIHGSLAVARLAGAS